MNTVRIKKPKKKSEAKQKTNAPKNASYLAILGLSKTDIKSLNAEIRKCYNDIDTDSI